MSSAGGQRARQRLYSQIYGKLPDVDPQIDIAEEFYEASKLYRTTHRRQIGTERLSGDDGLWRSQAMTGREMPHLTRTRLPQASAAAQQKPLIRAKSAERFSSKLIPVDVIGILLWLTYGVYPEEVSASVPEENMRSGAGRRPVASGCGLHPLELYVLVRAPGKESSLFHYNPGGQCLENLERKVDSRTYLSLGPPSEALKAAPVVVIIAGLIPRMRFVYGVTGYRLILMEAGAVTQQLQLVAQSLGLGSRPYMLYDQPVEALCGMDGVDEVFIGAVLVGYDDD